MESKESNHKHVVPRKFGWGVKSANSQRASKVFETQGEAIAYAKDLAKKHKVGMVVHDNEGKFEDFVSKPEIKDQHVMKKGDMWAVTEQGGDHISKMFENKGAAMAHAYDVASKHDTCMLIHDSDGKFKSVTCPRDRKPGILEVVRMKLKM